MASSDAPNPWKVGDLLDVMDGMAQVADQIEWESMITVFRAAGGGASQEVAAGALYRDMPREDGGVTATSRDAGGVTCAAGRPGGGGRLLGTRRN